MQKYGQGRKNANVAKNIRKAIESKDNFKQIRQPQPKDNFIPQSPPKKKAPPKQFVIDTNVVLFDPEAIFKMDDNHVIIPEIVLEEVDKFKTEQSERGQNSRKFSRYLDELRHQGSLVNGVSLGEGKGTLRIEFSTDTNRITAPKYNLNIPDNKIIYMCDTISKRDHVPVILISKDINLRVKANSINVIAQDYLNEKVVAKGETSYQGRTIAYASSTDITAYRSHPEAALSLDDLFDADGNKFSEPLICNEFVEIYNIEAQKSSATLGRFDGHAIVHLKFEKYFPKGVHPRNIGQSFALECLMQPPEVAPLVILKGNAGTGKTFLALAAGLEQYAKNHQSFNRILICRPSIMMDENLGFLPGSEKDKIEPYMRAVKDNVFALNYGEKTMSPKEYKTANEEIDMMFEDEFIKAESLAYQRGRSLNYHWFILDEMQNSTIRQAKAIITRCGKGTKIILMGDPEQIDSPYLDEHANGLTYAAEKMKGSSLCWQVTMKNSECVRSKLAREGAIRM